MPLHISGLKLPIDPTPAAPASSSPLSSGFGSSVSAGDGLSFKDVLGSAINQVEGAQTDANQAAAKFLAGDGEDLHTAVLATQRADLEFQMFMQVRNKIVSAYQEIMKMQM